MKSGTEISTRAGSALPMDRGVSFAMAQAFIATGAGADPAGGAAGARAVLPALQAKAKLCLRDFLAAALSSTDLPWVEQARAVAQADPSSQATLIGTAERATADNAAFANAVAGHGLVRDDMHLGSVSHLGVVVLPAVLAYCETATVSGQALLNAIVIGYEAGGRLGRALVDSEIARIHRPTGTVGPFAATAALASLAGLDAGRYAAALGLAANMAAGYNEWAASGGTEMFFHPGFAARNAFLAVRLAASGATVSATAIDGDAGLLAAFGKSCPASLAMPFAGGAEILDVFFKQVPACNYAQTAAQAARDLAGNLTGDLAGDTTLAADAVSEVLVRVPAAAAAYPGCDAPGPLHGTLQAKMSIQYNVAASLLTGHFDEANYRPEAQPAIAELAARIVVETDAELTRAYPARQGAEVTVSTRDGRRISRQQKSVTPASAETVAARFLSAAEARLGQATAARLDAVIDRLETLTDAALLPSACGT